jgi:hypothetical protein
MKYKEYNFAEAIGQILEGKRVTRLDWRDKRDYCLLKDGILQIHKAGESKETLHPWIINDGDLTGLDWLSLEDEE